jgi:hypothetical protein
LILFAPIETEDIATDVVGTGVALGVTDCVGKTNPGRQGVVVVVKMISANVLVMLSHCR